MRAEIAHELGTAEEGMGTLEPLDWYPLAGYTHTHIHTHKYTHIHTRTHTYMHTHAYARVCVCVCVCVCTHAIQRMPA